MGQDVMFPTIKKEEENKRGDLLEYLNVCMTHERRKHVDT